MENMKFTKLELDVFELLANNAKTKLALATNLNKSLSRISIAIKNLLKKELITKDYALRNNLVTQLLAQNILKNPDLKKPLTGIRLSILINLLEKKSVQELKTNLKVSQSSLYSHLSYLIRRSLTIRSADLFTFNKSMWPNLLELLDEINKQELNLDTRVPIGAKIFGKTNDSILFESNNLVSNAAPSGFSVYADYNLDIQTPFYFQRLPKRRQNLTQVFADSLIIAKELQDIRYNTLLLLFCLKNKSNLLRNIDLDIKLNRILQGEIIPNFPSKQELDSKAQMYDIKI